MKWAPLWKSWRFCPQRPYSCSSSSWSSRTAGSPPTCRSSTRCKRTTTTSSWSPLSWSTRWRLPSVARWWVDTWPVHHCLGLFSNTRYLKPKGPTVFFWTVFPWVPAECVRTPVQLPNEAEPGPERWFHQTWHGKNEHTDLLSLRPSFTRLHFEEQGLIILPICGTMSGRSPP